MGSAQKGQFFKIIDELRARHSLLLLLHHSGLSKAGYYKWRSAGVREDSDKVIVEHIKAIHSLRPYYGYRRMQVALGREGFTVNHKRVYRIMRELGVQSLICKKRRYFGKSGSTVFPDLLCRDFKSIAPGMKLVADITYLPTANGFIYLSAVQDLYNNEIISYSLSAKNDLALVFATLSRTPAMPGAVLHSDQGFQYTHKAYQERLGELQLVGSHSRKGNCLDNACMESFFSHLKTETFIGKSLLTRDETVTLVDEYIRFYNTERFQKRLGQLSPIEYREKLAA